MAKKGFGGQLLGGLGHLSTLWDIFKVLAGPLVGYLTFVRGLGSVPVPYLIAAACVAAGATMWFLNQVTTFLRRYREGYAWGLAYEGVTLGLNPNNPNATIQLSVQLRNASQRPMRYRVERFDVLIGDRAPANSTILSTGGIIQHGVARLYAGPAYRKSQIKDLLGKSAEGSVSFEVSYGHPESSFVRRLRMKVSLGLNLALDGHHGAKDLIQSEHDEAI